MGELRPIVLKARSFFDIDWLLLSSALLISGAGLVTMHSFVEESPFFNRQIIWLSISLIVFFAFSLFDWRFLRRSSVTILIFLISFLTLFLLFFLGSTVKGAERWINFGIFSFQPTDPAKIALIILLAKYFSKRHIEIAHLKHVLVSGFYAFVLFLMIFLQPDLGSSIIIFFIWFGMVMVSGISKKHVLAVLLAAFLSLTFLWFFVLADYQKQRLMTFVNPLADIQGAGYHSLQSMIAVGSGQFFGKGIGFGTQSRLRFLPEYQTDFIFAAFAEEWGFFGVLILLGLFVVFFWRLIVNSIYGSSNFEILFAAGLSFWIISHFTVHVGMNIGILPITGITLPFMSYGGSHLLAEFAALGILMGMRKYRSAFHKDEKEEKILV